MNRFKKDEKVEWLRDTNLGKKTLCKGEKWVSKRHFPSLLWSPLKLLLLNKNSRIRK